MKRSMKPLAAVLVAGAATIGLNYGIPDPKRKIEYVIIHHTAGNEKNVEQIRAAQKKRGFRDVAYHFVIFPDGSALPGRKITESAAGVYGNSKNTVEIVLVGELHKRPPTKEQWDKATGLAARACMSQKLPYWRVRGHREHALPGHATQCPGIDMKPFRIEVDKKIAYLKGFAEGVKNGS